MRPTTLATLLALALAPGLALAAPAPSRSCPPLGMLPGFAPQPARIRAYETVEFRSKLPNSDELETVQVSGRSCVVVLDLQPGRDEMSDLEVQMNYQQQLASLGAEIMGTGIRGTSARLVRNGAETWMNVVTSGSSIELRVVQKGPPRVTLLPPGANDYRLLGRMPNYTSGKPVARNFDQMEFRVADGDETRTVTAQGRTVRAEYASASNDTEATDEEIQFNYRDALAKLGAELLFQSGNTTTARLVSGGQTVWIAVESQGSGILVRAVEEKPFEPSIRPAQEALRTALDRTGRVALYVNFDFAKAVLRPDAAPVVAQVAAMLKADPSLRLSVEGHTDNVGASAGNQTLSRDRAAALVTALTAQGIAASRLTSAGYGADKPVASNDTSEGRARNRRVELVKM